MASWKLDCESLLNCYTENQPEVKPKTGHFVDFDVFKTIESGDHCHGDHSKECKAIDRVVAALDYYQFLVLAPKAAKYGKEPRTAFTSFCHELYPKKVMLNDYIHWVLHHKDPESIKAIRGRLHFLCESAKRCGAATRHFRNRRDDIDEDDDVAPNWFIDKMDSIHFNVYHLTELGLRVPAEVMESGLAPNDEKQDESNLVDEALRRMGREIESKRTVFSSERLDGAVNSKFTLQIDGQTGSGQSNVDNGT